MYSINGNNAVLEQYTRPRTYQNTCASGDTRFLLVPSNMLGRADMLSIDTTALSGVAGAITVQVRDAFLPMGGSSSSVLRFPTAIMPGDVTLLDFKGQVQLFGGVDIRVNVSGPIVALGASFR